jgi:hypothetical protein
VDACIECKNSLVSICMSSMIMTGCMATISSSAVYPPLGKAVPISKPTFSCCVNPKKIKALLKSSAHVAAYYILTSTHWMENAAQDCKRIIRGV